MTTLFLVIGIQYIQSCWTKGCLNGCLGHTCQRDEDLLLEIESRTYAHQNCYQDTDDDTRQETADTDVHRVAVQLVDLDLGTGYTEEDRLEDHPEDLEGCRYWVL